MRAFRRPQVRLNPGFEGVEITVHCGAIRSQCLHLGGRRSGFGHRAGNERPKQHSMIRPALSAGGVYKEYRMRRTNMWTYFLSLICAAALTLLLLPACGGGSSESCNTPLLEEAAPELCDLEEDDEELKSAEDELEDELQEDTGFEEENIEAFEEGLTFEEELLDEL